MTSLFRRVQRYQGTADLDPRENRLTEALASVLEHVSWLPPELVRFLCGINSLDPSDDEGFEASMRTQRATLTGGFVDLEIRLTDRMRTARFGEPSESPRPTIICWVEVKHGADVHGLQLEHYVDALGTEGTLTMLVPRGSP